MNLFFKDAVRFLCATAATIIMCSTLMSCAKPQESTENPPAGNDQVTTADNDQATTTIPEGIRNSYDEVNQVVSKCDFEAFQTYFSNDFTYIDPEGNELTRDEFLAELEGVFKANKSATSSQDFKGVTEHDGVYDVSFEMTVVFSGDDGDTTAHEIGVDSWKQIDGKWQMIKTVDTVFTITEPSQSES